MSDTPKNGIDELREILFETLRGVKAGNIDINRAKAVGDLTQVLVNTAKIEVEFLKATKGKGKASAFFPALEAEAGPADGNPPAPNPGLPPGTLPQGFVGVRQHRLSDTEPEE